jgi:hypothetical protein
MAKLVENLLVNPEIRKALHPPYSPDLAPSDFYPLGHVKQLMTGQSFENADELFSSIGAILHDIEKVGLI